MKQISNDQINANEKRKQAEQLRINASRLYDDNSRKTYLEDEAMKQDHEAEELEKRAVAAQTEVTQKEAQVKTLEHDRATKIQAHDQEIAQIDQQIANLRGGAFM